MLTGTGLVEIVCLSVENVYFPKPSHISGGLRGPSSDYSSPPSLMMLIVYIFQQVDCSIIMSSPQFMIQIDRWIYVDPSIHGCMLNILSAYKEVLTYHEGWLYVSHLSLVTLLLG